MKRHGDPEGTGHRVTEAEQLALLQLRRLPRVGDVHCAALISAAGSAREALRRARHDGAVEPADNQAWAAEQLARARQLGIRLLTLYDADYPELLRRIPDPPVVLFVRGRIELLHAPGVAIVGSRRCSSYGKDVARRFGRDLAARGLSVVSGLALGIDGAAHEGALEVGDTVAVLGCGVDRVYPARHRTLFDRIGKAGAIVSEVPLGQAPGAGSFPRRNRIISGLALGVIVVEAPERSGALITARCAAEQNREVFAVPGEITNPRCAGTLALLRDGACLARHAQDVLDELSHGLPADLFATAGTTAGPERPPEPSKPEPSKPEHSTDACLLELLETGSCHLDDLTRGSGMAPATVLQRMLQLELAGLVQAHSGGTYRRCG